MNGAERITAERQRQVEVEGYTTQGHDVPEYRDHPGALTMAAICYASMAGAGKGVRGLLRFQGAAGSPPRHWPWGPEQWKPSGGDTHADRIRELEKAGALLAAEIDRLLAEVAQGGGQ